LPRVCVLKEGICHSSVGGYEVHLSNERERVQKAYKSGHMSQKEYEIRLHQIRRDSAVQ
jgi:hypothetical protein